MAKVDYGAVALIPVGDYSASRQYHANELVGYQGSSYIALQNPPVGTLPTNTTYFMLHTEGTSIATASTPGTVKPDGTSTVVDGTGAMSVKPSILQTIQDTAESASKIGNVPTGETLQSQLNAAAQSIVQNTTDITQLKTDVAQNTTDITQLKTDVAQNTTDITQLKTDVAQNTTDIAANAAGISALNTGLTSKIGTFETQQANRILNIVHDTNSDEIIAHDEKLDRWFPIWQQVKYYQGTWLTPVAQNLVIDSATLFGWGRLRILCINFHFTQQTNLADGVQLFSMLSTAPVGSFFALARNGSSQMAQLALNGNKTINLWGAMQSVATSMWSVQFTYFTV